MKVIRAADCRTTPWKNGGGSTTEIAVEPLDASLDNFDWRISMARVASDGPFSEFAGIDRTLAVVEGGGLALSIGTNAAIILDRETMPVSFAGDTPTSARLMAGEIVDLNMMTRRGRFDHAMIRVRQPINREIGDDDIAIVVAPSGDVSVRSQQGAVILARGDSVILTRASGMSCAIEPTAGTTCYLVLLRASGA